MRVFSLFSMFAVSIPLLTGGCGSSSGTGDGSGLLSGPGAGLMQELVPANVVTSSLVNIGGVAYFLCVDPETGEQPWISDGTVEGTHILKEIDIGPDFRRRGNPKFTEFGGFVFFYFNDGFVGNELWRTDGTEAGTELVADLFSGSTFNSGSVLSASNEKLYMSESSGLAVLDLPDAEDGIPVFLPGPRQITEDSMVNIGGMAYYFGNEGDFGDEPWISDGTIEGTRRIIDIYQGPASSMRVTIGTNFAEFGGSVYFAANDGIVGRELWRTDGTEAGTELFADLVPGPEGISTAARSANLKASEERLYLSTQALGGDQFWAVELPDAEGAEFVTELTLPSTRITALENLGGIAYFLLSHPAVGTEPGISDGTRAGTGLLKDIVPGPGSGGILFGTGTPSFVAFDGAVFFFADDGIVGSELWRTDGTADGTALYVDLVPGPEGFSPEILAVSDERLYISGSGPEFEGRLFVIEAAP